MIRGLKRIQQPRNGIQFVVDTATREELKPIVFFDGGKFKKEDDGFTIGFHPHSGIGIITYFHGTDLHHRDSKLNDGIIHGGGVQWINAGGGVWHEESYHRKHDAPKTGEWEGSIHQLWLQLPPEFEEGKIEYFNPKKEDIPVVNNVKILASEYENVKGILNVPVNITYLDVNLKKGESWNYQTPKGQTTGYIFTRDGEIEIDKKLLPNSSMGILEHNEGTIKVKALSDVSTFILVIAEPSKFPVIAQGGQIHTNEESLKRSLHNIREMGKHL